MRAWIGWSVGLLAYIVAVLDRTTLGVSGLQAANRFGVSPGVLSSFVVLQVVVYAAAQVPAGVLLDKFGPKTLIATGGALMAAGQLTLAFTTSLPEAIGARAVLGLGDALTFISVLPLAALLSHAGWTTAYTSVAALGLLSVALTLSLVHDTPQGVIVRDEKTNLRATMANVKIVWLRPGTRLGFFTHMGTQFSVTVFALMWGVPYLTTAQGISTDAAGALLSVSVVTAILAGVVIGILTARYPMRRSWMVLGIIASNAAIWTVVLALPHRAPLWLLTVLVVLISVGGPGSMVGFDFARTFNPRATLGTAQGMVNMGGFLASIVVMQAMGVIIGATGAYSFESFRIAWTVQYGVWALAVVGILITRRKARRALTAAETRYLLQGIQPPHHDAAAVVPQPGEA